jgi:hypothetical protein
VTSVISSRTAPNRLRLLGVLVALVVTAAAGPATEAGQLPAARGATPEALSRRLCDAVQGLPATRKAECCGTSPNTGLASECARDLTRSLQERKLTLEPGDVDRCVADSTRDLEGCAWVTPRTSRLPASCRGIVHGTLDTGGRCRSSLECRDGLRCWGITPEAPGVCAPPGVPGAPCGGGPDALATFARQAEDGARHPECNGFCLLGRCAAFVRVGGECSSHGQCVPGSHCAARRCVDGPPPALGQACGAATCEAPFVCIDGTCAHPKKAGEACRQSLECEAACVSPTADQPGTCGMKCSVWPPAGYTPPVAAHPIEAAAP